MRSRMICLVALSALVVSAACNARPAPALLTPSPLPTTAPLLATRAPTRVPVVPATIPAPTSTLPVAGVTPTAAAARTLSPPLSHFRYLPSGLFLVVAGGELHIIDPVTQQVHWSAAPVEGCCSALAVEGDLLAAVAGGADVVYVWDTATNQQLVRLEDSAGHFSTLALSPDGQTLGTGEFGAIRLWALSTGQARASWATGDKGISWLPLTEGLTNLAFTPDNQTLYSANWWSGQVMQWNATTGDLQATLVFTNALRFAFTPDTSQLLVEYNDYGFELHDPQTGSLTALHDQIVGATGWNTFSADGQRVAVWGYNTVNGSTAAVWELATDTRLQEFSVGHNNPQWSRAALNPDGSIIALSNYANRIVFFDVATGQQIDEWWVR